MTTPDRKIAIIEDEPAISALLTRRLERLGYTDVESFVRGQNFISTLGVDAIANTYRAIITDWEGHYTDIIDTLKQIRDSEVAQNIPSKLIIVFSARPQIEIGDLESVNALYLQKPESAPVAQAVHKFFNP